MKNYSVFCASIIINDKELVDKAIFFSNINAALEERDKKTREIRHNLLERIAS